MPPKKGGKKAAVAAPAVPILDGCKIAISGTFPKPYTQAAVKAKAEELGASVASSVTGTATHVVATFADYSKPSAKVAKAQELSLPIVTLEWLLLCADGTKKPEAEYLPRDVADEDDDEDGEPDTKSTASQATATTAKSGRARAAKRAASPSPQAPNGISQTVAPKAKRAKKVAPKAEDDEDDDAKAASEPAEPPKPVTKGEPTEAELVVGRGQIAKRLDIAIPLDEGCPHYTHVVYIDPQGVIFDASLNQTNSGKNNNKFYRIQVRTRPCR
jgi:poly [ADP-ribose] polymerase 2/3/4